MAEILDTPDAVNLAVAAINAQMSRFTDVAGIKALGKIPKSRPAEFIFIRFSGGTKETFVTSTPTLLVEGWSQRMERAARLSRVGLSILLAEDNPRGIWGAFVIGLPVDLPDPTQSQERFSATVGVRVRDTPLA